MTHQRTLFGHTITRSRQPELFERGGRATDLRCEAYGNYLERTPSGYLACPGGCGRLREQLAEPDGGSGLWFEDGPSEE